MIIILNAKKRIRVAMSQKFKRFASGFGCWYGGRHFAYLQFSKSNWDRCVDLGLVQSDDIRVWNGDRGDWHDAD